MPPVVPPSEEDSTYRLRDIDDIDTTLWRYDQLVALGVVPLEATALSLISGAHHELEALVRAGCPLGVASQILL